MTESTPLASENHENQEVINIHLIHFKCYPLHHQIVIKFTKRMSSNENFTKAEKQCICFSNINQIVGMQKKDYQKLQICSGLFLK